MLQLSLRSKTFDDGPRKDDYSVIWTPAEYGGRRVGRIRLVTEYTRDEGERWEWAINPPMPRAGVGTGDYNGDGTADVLLQ
jgi:hypothetical protein